MNLKKINLLVSVAVISVGMFLAGQFVSIGTAVQLPADEQEFVNLVDHTMPSVVSVVGKKLTKEGYTISSARGSGFIVKSNGLIVTNKHVIIDETLSYDVILSDGTTYLARVVATDPINDIALIKVEGLGLPTLELGDSDQLEIGQTAFAIGNSLGKYPNTVTKGIISGLGRVLSATSNNGRTETLDSVIQTDAAINSGNSGGPLLNSRGQVVGMNTAVEREGAGIAFAIPSNMIEDALVSYEKKGEISRPFLGVRFLMINSDLQATLKLAYGYGALIDSGILPDPPVVLGGPADKAGIKKGDIILSINGQALGIDNSLRTVIQEYSPGDVINLEIARGEQIFKQELTLGSAPK
jgi:S1-C subfamily serine protease